MMTWIKMLADKDTVAAFFTTEKEWAFKVKSGASVEAELRFVRFEPDCPSVEVWFELDDDHPLAIEEVSWILEAKE